MFIKFPDPAEFNKRDFTTTDETLAQEYVTFLEQQLSNQFYPPFLETLVHPGFIFRSTNSFTYFPRHWDYAGSDFWYQTKETFEINNIDASPFVLNALRIHTAKQVNAYQAKLFLSGMWKIERPKQRSWILSLNGDYTWLNFEIRRDWSIGFNFEAHF